MLRRGVVAYWEEMKSLAQCAREVLSNRHIPCRTSLSPPASGWDQIVYESMLTESRGFSQEAVIQGLRTC